MASSSEDDPNIDPEVRYIMEGTARLVAKHGLWLESRFLKYNADKKLYDFLRSPDHHYHAFYRNKIVEYRKAQQKKVIKPPDPTNNVAQPPSLEIKCPEGMSPKDFGVIKLTAQFVVRYGSYFWPDLCNSVTMNPNPQLAFINASDYRFNVLLELVDAYAKILTPYWKRSASKPNRHACKESFLQGFFNILQGKKQDEEEGVEIEIERESAVFDLHDLSSGCLDYFACSDDGKWKLPGRISAQMLSDGMLDSPPQDQHVPLFTDDDPLIPRDYPFTYPKGITRRQLGIIKVTAQFYVRYGYAFWMALMRRLAIIDNSQLNSQFEFTIMSQDSSRYSFFYRLVASYSKVLMPSSTCPERAVLKGFFNLLQRENQEIEVGVEISESVLQHSFVNALDYFANREDQVLTPHGCFSSAPTQMHPYFPVPLPKGPHWRSLLRHCHHVRNQSQRDKLHKSALVPNDQFLAQHSGSVMIRVSVPNMDSEKVVEITLQSLSESVASLKEKIARKIQIPANKQNLWGKAGFLKKDNMSLAHYYVEAGETLIMSL